MSAHAGQTHHFEYLRDAVAYRGSGSEREVDYAELRAEKLRGFAPDELTRAGDLERGALDHVRYLRKVLALAFFERGGNDSRTGYADVYGSFALAETGERSRHERVILHRVGEHHELGATYRAPVRSALRKLLDRTSHHGDGVHIDTAARGRDVDG